MSNRVYRMNSKLCVIRMDTLNKQKNDVCNRKWRHVNNKCFPVEFKDN